TAAFQKAESEKSRRTAMWDWSPPTSSSGTGAPAAGRGEMKPWPSGAKEKAELPLAAYWGGPQDRAAAPRAAGRPRMRPLVTRNAGLSQASNWSPPKLFRYGFMPQR